MTFSLVARCPDSGLCGIAIASSSPAVAARCAFARAGVGAVASQNVTDPRLGPAALERLAGGADATATIAALRAERPHMDYRQLLVVGRAGAPAIHSGARALGTWAEARGAHSAAGGNLLGDARVPAAMVAAFEGTGGALGERLLGALEAGRDAGGEAGPVHSAGLLMVDRVPWPIAELRCDWSEDCPIEAVARAWRRYEPELEAYVQRALDPTGAPSYGVPGDP